MSQAHKQGDDVAGCYHLTVTRGREHVDAPPIWTCVECADQFFTAADMQYVASQHEAILDAMAAVHSATLWDLHKRSLEAVGVGVPDVDMPHDCEADGHNFGDGALCVYCLAPRFLGGGE